MIWHRFSLSLELGSAGVEARAWAVKRLMPAYFPVSVVGERLFGFDTLTAKASFFLRPLLLKFHSTRAVFPFMTCLFLASVGVALAVGKAS